MPFVSSFSLKILIRPSHRENGVLFYCWFMTLHKEKSLIVNCLKFCIKEIEIIRKQLRKKIHFHLSSSWCIDLLGNAAYTTYCFFFFVLSGIWKYFSLNHIVELKKEDTFAQSIRQPIQTFQGRWHSRKPCIRFSVLVGIIFCWASIMWRSYRWVPHTASLFLYSEPTILSYMLDEC